MPAEGFKGERLAIGEHVVGQVQLDYGEQMEPLRVMYGSVEAKLEVQRTIKRAELKAFLCLLSRVIGKVHVDNKGMIDELREEKVCV